MVARMGSATEIRIGREKAVAAVFTELPFETVAMLQQMDMGNGLAQRHHHLPGIELPGEQYRQQFLRGCRLLSAVLLNRSIRSS